MASGMLLQAVGLAAFAGLAGSHAGYLELVGPLVVAGVGISMALPTTPAAALSAVPVEEMGKASGANTTLQRFGGAFGVAVVTAVFTAHGHIGSASAFDAGFRPALAVAAGLSLIGAGSALAVAKRRRAAAPTVVEATPSLVLSDAA